MKERAKALQNFVFLYPDLKVGAIPFSPRGNSVFSAGNSVSSLMNPVLARKASLLLLLLQREDPRQVSDNIDKFRTGRNDDFGVIGESLFHHFKPSQYLRVPDEILVGRLVHQPECP